MYSNKFNAIVSATKELANKLEYKDINIQKIDEYTSFSRASIYYYFHNKEEIFIYILTEEYNKIIAEIQQLKNTDIKMTKNTFADKMARIFDQHHLMLKLISNNLTDLQEKSRMTYLIKFKKSYGNFLATYDNCLKKFFPNLSKDQIENINYAFFPFLYGIYPFSSVTDKQKEGLTKAGFIYKPHSVYNLVFNMLITIL
ncbi:TetR family transcriptional regulator [Apilactobacillus quenuiae]|uniref:TetR family transcriptional regulator n=1 Tax=Apilactobacillus quenuiae TaxID=2008377 RepID=UPI000D0186AF|nr:TetR family transcriptional regulator [Apilactobacillus quenuiae]